MPRARKSTTTVIVEEDNNLKITEPVIGRLTNDVLEFHGQKLKEELITNSSHYELNEDQIREVCKAIDVFTIKSKAAALRQVVSIFKV